MIAGIEGDGTGKASPVRRSAVAVSVGSPRQRPVLLSFGVSPPCGAGLLRCPSSRCQRPSVSPLRAAIPHAASPPPSALAGAQGVAGLRRGAPGRCARQCSDQGCAFIAMQNSQVRLAVPAGMTTSARSRARGSRALFPSRVRERGPLDELTRCSRAARHFAALRSAPQAAPVPDRHPGHPPCPMPGR